MTEHEAPGVFSSVREQRLWLWTVLVVAAIYATLGLGRTLAEELADRNLSEGAFIAGFVLILIAIAVIAWRVRPGGAEIGVGLGVLGAYLIAFARLGIAEERTHLFEYGLVAVLVYEALAERRRNGRRVPVPALLAITGTAALGVIDESIQAVLPSRVYDVRDVGFNVLAAVMAVVASLALAWARRLRVAR